MTGWVSIQNAIVAAQDGPCQSLSVLVDHKLDENNYPAGVRTLRAAQIMDEKDNETQIKINDNSAGNSEGIAEKVYWLPWGQNPTLAMRRLNEDASVSYFLTSPMSGCYMVGSKELIMHTAAGYKSGDEKYENPVRYAFDEMTEWHEEVDENIRQTFVLSPTGGSAYIAASSFYGDGELIVGEKMLAGAPRAVVMGYKHGNSWIFAYQDNTVGTAYYGYWRKMR